MAINKDNVLDASWNNESLLQIRTALQELLNALGDSIDAAADGNPASINLSVEGTVLTATVTLADGETELSSSVDLAGAISAAQVAVEIVNNLYTDSSSKALSAAMGVQLDRMSGTVLKHLHWVPGAAHALLAVGNHARYFAPELGKIYHFYGYTPFGQGQPELGLDVYTPPAGIIFYDIETGSCYRFNGTDMVDILSSKANAADVAGIIEDNVSVEQPANPDGTFTIRIGTNTYTVNLNHTHENMAKLEKHTPATLPDIEDMEEDTIYAEVEDGEVSVLYIGGVPFYGGGGGASSGPVLRRPADGATIDMGQTTSGTASNTINVKGKSLTQALTIELDGAGYSFGTTQPSGVTRDSSTQLTVTAAAANAMHGVDIAVEYSGSSDDSDVDAKATLSITSDSPDNISKECWLVVNSIKGVMLTGSQYLETSYKPNANTEFVLKCHFIPNSNTTAQDSLNALGWLFTCGQGSGNYFDLYSTRPSANQNNSPYNFYFRNGDNLETNQCIIALGSTKMTHDPVIIRLVKGQNNSTFSAESTTIDSATLPNKSGTNSGSLVIGKYVDGQGNEYYYSRYNLVIYEFIITENSVEKLHLVPAMHNGAACLYDTVGETYIGSSTQTALEAVI